MQTTNKQLGKYDKANTLWAFLFAAVWVLLDFLHPLVRAQPYVPSYWALLAGDAMRGNGQGVDPAALSTEAKVFILGGSGLATALLLIFLYFLYRVGLTMLSGEIVSQRNYKYVSRAACVLLVWLFVAGASRTLGNNLAARDLGFGDSPLFRGVSAPDSLQIWWFIILGILTLLQISIRRILKLQDDVEGLV